MTEERRRQADDRMRAVTAALVDETARIAEAGARWHPYIVVATALAGVAALLKLFA